MSWEYRRRWWLLEHRILADVVRELTHMNCWLASNRPWVGAKM